MEKQVIKPYGQTEIDNHAAKVGGARNLREIIIETDDDMEFHYLVKKPSRSVIQAITDAEKKKDINVQQKIILGCVLEGDKEAYEYDGAIYSQLLSKVGQLMESAKGTIKKL